jgi:hypothetical protein
MPFQDPNILGCRRTSREEQNKKDEQEMPPGLIHGCEILLGNVHGRYPPRAKDEPGTYEEQSPSIA